MTLRRRFDRRVKCRDGGLFDRVRTPDRGVPCLIRVRHDPLGRLGRLLDPLLGRLHGQHGWLDSCEEIPQLRRGVSSRLRFGGRCHCPAHRSSGESTQSFPSAASASASPTWRASYPSGRREFFAHFLYLVFGYSSTSDWGAAAGTAVFFAITLTPLLARLPPQVVERCLKSNF